MRLMSELVPNLSNKLEFSMLEISDQTKAVGGLDSSTKDGLNNSFAESQTT